MATERQRVLLFRKLENLDSRYRHHINYYGTRSMRAGIQEGHLEQRIEIKKCIGKAVLYKMNNISHNVSYYKTKIDVRDFVKDMLKKYRLSAEKALELAN